MKDSSTTRLSELSLEEMIEDELKCLKCELELELSTGKFPLDPDDFKGYKSKADWLEYTMPVKSLRLK